MCVSIDAKEFNSNKLIFLSIVDREQSLKGTKDNILPAMIYVVYILKRCYRSLSSSVILIYNIKYNTSGVEVCVVLVRL